MGKEAKIGIAVVCTLLIAFCGVLYQRISKLKTTPDSVAQKEPEPPKKSEKSDLFAAANKLTAVAPEGGDTVEAPSTEKSPFKWNTPPAAEPAAEPVARDTKPRATFLPAEEPEPPAATDRYGNRYAKVEGAAEQEPVGEVAEPTEAAEPAAEVADVAVEESDNVEAPQPNAISNPFARVQTNDLADTGAPAESPEMAEEPVAQPNFDQDETAELAAEADVEVAAEPPARLDHTAVPAAAVAEAAPPRQEIYAAPKSRYFNEPAEPAQDMATDRYGAAATTRAATARTTAQSNIAGGKYTLGPNENFWSVSEKAYGNGGYFKALHAYNAEKYPIADEIAVGDEIYVPLKSDLEQQFPQLCPKPGRLPARKSYAIQASAQMRASGNTYVVQEGDTLFDIARYELGKASRWAELYDLNRDVIGDDIDFLRAGMELVLPDDEGKADAVTRQPGGALQR